MSASDALPTHAPVRKTILRGLTNWLQAHRSQLFRDCDEAHGSELQPSNLPDHVAAELRLLDGWIGELKAAQRRRGVR